MESKTEWLTGFPGLARLGADLIGVLTRSGSVITLPAAGRIYGPGQAPERYLLLLDGSVRVQQVSEGGRAIVLYRVSAGESCALTTACLMGCEDYLAEAITEADIHAVAIPRGTFDDLIARSSEFGRSVFTAFSRRVTDLFHTIEEVAFSRMDIHLAHRLLEPSHGSDDVTATQQQLASELGWRKAHEQVIPSIDDARAASRASS